MEDVKQDTHREKGREKKREEGREDVIAHEGQNLTYWTKYTYHFGRDSLRWGKRVGRSRTK